MKLPSSDGLPLCANATRVLRSQPTPNLWWKNHTLWTSFNDSTAQLILAILTYIRCHRLIPHRFLFVNGPDNPRWPHTESLISPSAFRHILLNCLWYLLHCVILELLHLTDFIAPSIFVHSFPRGSTWCQHCYLHALWWFYTFLSSLPQ